MFGWWATVSFGLLAAVVGVLATLAPEPSSTLPAAGGLVQRGLLGLWLMVVAAGRGGAALALPAPPVGRWAGIVVAAALAAGAVVIVRDDRLALHSGAVLAAVGLLAAGLADVVTALATPRRRGTLLIRAAGWLAAAPVLGAADPAGTHGLGVMLPAAALLTAAAEAVLAVRVPPVATDTGEQPATPDGTSALHRDDLSLAS
jgi:hypothetical protein